MNQTQLLFQPSGLNEVFLGGECQTFSEYILQTRHMLQQARVDLTPANCAHILQTNSPQEWAPANPAADHKQGILLIHGLFDSPFLVSDVGAYFAKQGFKVRSILLPGHGTVPGDLLHVRYAEWIKAVDYAVETFGNDTKQLFVLGFSLGGTLALHKALRDKRIGALILIAPALAIKQQWLTGLAISWQRKLAWVLPKNGWYKKRDFQEDHCHYESFTINAVQQIYQLILETSALARTRALTIPVFFAVTAEDEVISSQSCLRFFTAHHHPQSQMIWYGRQALTSADKRIIPKSSCFTTDNIIDFSHICLPIAPNNPHYGKGGRYQNYLHYPANQPPANQAIFLGAATKKNLCLQAIQRLSYNPDFYNMVESMSSFLRAAAPADPS